VQRRAVVRELWGDIRFDFAGQFPA